MKELLKAVTEKILPKQSHLFIRYFYLKILGKLDTEILYVSKLLINKRRFLDIGANVGIYSYYFRNKFNRVDAYEPLTEITYRLKSLGSNAIKVHNVALSDKKGKLKFNIPLINGKALPPLASLERRDCECEVREVDVDTIDNYGFRDVDLIKIDVEGHEEMVVLGAADTIKACKPIMIIEIEQRHISKKINEVFNSILNFDYEGFFLLDGVLLPLSNFSYEIHQKPYLDDVIDKRYVNNFIFKPK